MSLNSPERQMVASVLDHVETFFNEVGTPLTADQMAQVEAARAELVAGDVSA